MMTYEVVLYATGDRAEADDHASALLAAKTMVDDLLGAGFRRSHLMDSIIITEDGRYCAELTRKARGWS